MQLTQNLNYIYYSIIGEIIPQKDSFKYLGGLISTTVKWDKHMDTSTVGASQVHTVSGFISIKKG